MQKTEFLKALSDMWKDFDSRVLRYKVFSIPQFIRSIFFQPILLTYVYYDLNVSIICLYDVMLHRI
jgi:hypothetical protein